MMQNDENNHSDVIHHLLFGTSDLCMICLTGLETQGVNIHSTFCCDDEEFSISEALRSLGYFVAVDDQDCIACIQCVRDAFCCYRFKAKWTRSQVVLQHYLTEIEKRLEIIDEEKTQLNKVYITLERSDSAGPLASVTEELLQNAISEGCTNIGEAPVRIRINNGKIKTEKQCDMELMEISSDSKFGIKKCNEENDDDMRLMIVTDNGDSILYNIELSSETNQVKKKARRKTVKIISRCDVCMKRYKKVSMLKNHLRREHGIKYYHCKQCQALLASEADYRFHVRTHTDRYVCAECGDAFVGRRVLINHLRARHGFVFMEDSVMGSKSVQCDACGAIFASGEQLAAHARKKHARPAHYYRCHYCSKPYKLLASFRAHVAKHEKMLNPSATSEAKCEQCGRSFEDAASLEEHEAVCRRGRAFECAECGKRFKTNCGLGMHAASHKRRHDKQCEECGRSFRSRRSLTWHRRLHTGERPFECRQCGRGFISLNRHNQHVLTAHTEPTKRCPLCPSTFHLSSMVNTHLKKVHFTPKTRKKKMLRHLNPEWINKEPVPLQELSLEVQSELLLNSLEKKTLV